MQDNCLLEVENFISESIVHIKNQISCSEWPGVKFLWIVSFREKVLPLFFESRKNPSSKNP